MTDTVLSEIFGVDFALHDLGIAGAVDCFGVDETFQSAPQIGGIYLGPPNHDGSYRLGRFAGEQQAGLVKRAELLLVALGGGGNTRDRVEGFRSGFCETFPGTVVLHEIDGRSLLKEVVRQATDSFSAHPGINVVFGLNDPVQYGQLPANGNPASYQITAESVMMLALPPLLVTLAAVMGMRDRRAFREGLATRLSRPRLVATCALAMIGAALLWTAWPIGQPPYPLYESGQGYHPYQQFIDAARGAGGLVFWSMVEARDHETHLFGPVGRVTVTTEPHPEALILTNHHTGFGGLYQEAHRAIQPGQVWDQAIELFLRGERPQSPVMLGEIAFHALDHAGKDLDQVLSIVSARSRTVEDLLEAVRTGRLYAVERRKKEFALRLETFRIECDAGRRGASAGEILDPEGHRDMVIRISISTTDRQAHHITATVIRSGETLARLSGTTPLTVDIPDKTAPAGRWLAYRLLVEGEGELVSNPVFVGPMPSAQFATAVTREARS